MSHIKLIACSAIALLVGGAGGYWWAHRAGASRAAGTVTGERVVLYWHDPMVPTAKFNKPGKSPFMDMQLVPVYADEAAQSTGVSVSANVQQNLGIRLAKVESEVLLQKLSAVGTVVFDEHAVAIVQSRVAGAVVRLLTKAPLDHVRRGQPLLELTAPEWLEAEGEYQILLSDNAPASVALRGAARQRLIVLGIPTAAIQQVERTRLVPRTVTLYAPIDGVVTELSVREGAAVAAGTPLFRINGLATVWVQAAVPEAQLSLIPMKSAVEVRANAWPAQTFNGRVEAVLPQVDAVTRAIPVRIAVDNRNGRLSPGMFVNIAFRGGAQAPQLVVPSEAVIMTGERTVVIVAEASGSFSVANVTVGREAGGKTAILSGLTAGQSVVASGQFLIDSEASLTSTIDRLTAVQSHAIPSHEDNGSQSSQPARTMHLGQGTITAIGPKTLTIAHGPIPSLNWNAMTMAFTRPTHALPLELKVGDTVTFSFSESDAGGYRLDAVAVIEPASTDSAAASGKSP